MRLLWALGLFSALLHVTSCLRIGTFNIQCFGPKKSGIKDPKNKYEEARDIIKKIVLRYDIILIQEVRCPDEKVTDTLKDLVNDGSDQFKHTVSEYLGPANHKERYLFLYRHNKVSVKDWFQYDVKGFDRPPFVVQFSSTHTAVKDFVLIPIHTKPDHAVQEIDALVDVVEAAREEWNNNNIMVLGDFNAGSRYVGKGKRKDISLLTDKGFHSLIDDGVATTLAETTQTHDRIFVSDEMNKGVVPGTAKVFDFRQEYDLGDQAKEVSDHFPVEVELEL